MLLNITFEGVMLVPELRVRTMNQAPVREQRDYVLYWMIAYRRTRWNFSLDRALSWALELQRPLVIFEPLSSDYPWASDRFHQFVQDGMNDNDRALAQAPVTYFRYIEPEPHAGRGLLEALASRACVVLTDDYPAFFLPKIVRAAAARLDVRLEAVDSNGLYVQLCFHFRCGGVRISPSQILTHDGLAKTEHLKSQS